MAVRTTAAAVGLIIKVKSSISLTSFIEAANAIVTQHCTNTAFTSTQLELIERWLSAHMYRNRDMQSSYQKAGVASKGNQSKVDLGFSNSIYGQHAMLLDWSGALSALNEQVKKGAKLTASVEWAGTTYSELDDTLPLD